jgi:hypothetical protein
MSKPTQTPNSKRFWTWHVSSCMILNHEVQGL